MASHMGVQALATERNSNVEYMVHYILDEFAKCLSRSGELTNYELVGQKKFSSEIASDVWDHYLDGLQKDGRRIELWCQTTCYKGNKKGSPEPNKTYEVRETLVEGISIRESFIKHTEIDKRSVHFTVGDKRYTYKWFLDLKSSAYDKSIYIGDLGYDIFSDIASALKGCITEEEKGNSLRLCVEQESVLGTYIKAAMIELCNWWDAGKQSADLATLQWNLVSDRLSEYNGNWPDLSSVIGGDIKGRVNATIFNEEQIELDPLIPKTAVTLLVKNPFLQSAVGILAGWETFCADIGALGNTHKEVDQFLQSLWDLPPPRRLVIRRLLLRIHTDSSIAYVQDLDVSGVSEHNVYAGDHSREQVDAICEKIEKNLKEGGYSKVGDIVGRITSHGKRLVNQARWFEAKNGTQLKPSFRYVELALVQAGFEVVSPSAAGIRAVGYHSEISDERVNAYTNLKVVKDREGRVVCLLKAKFFRVQEFARRCKEEAFVGLSLKYKYLGGEFISRFNIPLIMYVDMSRDCAPQEYAIKRLISFGWDVVFTPEELVKKLTL